MNHSPEEKPGSIVVSHTIADQTELISTVTTKKRVAKRRGFTVPAESSANPATPSVQVPLPPPATSRAKKSSSKRERPEVVSVEGEEAAKEDPDADLKQKRRQKEKGK
ncbi:hypothetical protein PIB30_021425 [Stylosanthes scabra]|uniref:Uncharacterized protein n=1 Tax=Stylosanthes scabra TaxID=79078 RepID=A0ABU6U922_9FABA|nr:hypothetical protein [Stylosanthes scabra]